MPKLGNIFFCAIVVASATSNGIIPSAEREPVAIFTSVRPDAPDYNALQRMLNDRNREVKDWTVPINVCAMPLTNSSILDVIGEPERKFISINVVSAMGTLVQKKYFDSEFPEVNITEAVDSFAYDEPGNFAVSGVPGLSINIPAIPNKSITLECDDLEVLDYVRQDKLEIKV